MSSKSELGCRWCGVAQPAPHAQDCEFVRTHPHVYPLELQPIGRDEACAFIRQHHRHHLPPAGYKWAVAVNDGVRVVGVATIGRPVARHLDDGWTAEVTRVCTDGTPHVCSMLYAAAWRAARAMGYRRLGTYLLASESGTSVKAAGWRLIGERGGGSWSRPGRPRVDRHPIEQKALWGVGDW